MTETTAARPHRPRLTRRVALIAAAGALVVGVGIWWIARSSGPSQGGPLENPEVTASGLRQHPGDLIGYGVPMAWNDGDEPVTLESARLINPTSGMQVVHTYASPPDRKKNGIAYSETWPSDEFSDLRPVAGLSVPPRSTPAGEKGVMIVFALKLPDRAGDFQHDGVEVAYRAGGKDYVTTIRTSMRVCVVPESEDLQGPCDSPDAFKASD